MINQPTPIVTANDVQRIVRRDFPSEHLAAAMDIIKEYGTEKWHSGCNRVQLAVLKLANGNLKDLRRYIEVAKRDYRDVLNLDPSYAEAYARLGSCYGILGHLTAIPPNESLPRNKAAAEKALEIDDTVSEAHAQLAFATMFYDHDWPRAKKEFERALELNPSNANAHRGLAQYFISNARFEDALTEIEQARKLDPVSLGINFDQGWFLHFARKPDEAIAQLQRTLDMDPNFAVAHSGLGNAYELKGQYERAIAEYQTAIALSGQISGQVTGRIASLGHAYAMAGRKNEALQTLTRLKELARRQYVSPYHTSLIYVGLGDKTDAFAWLEKAYNDHYWMMAFLKVDPRLDPLRSDMRFKDMLRRVGLDR
jgi:tetratricopeptide (TPR) repeat protein